MKKKVDDDIGYTAGLEEGDDDGEAGIIRKKTMKREIDSSISYEAPEFQGDNNQPPGIVERKPKEQVEQESGIIPHDSFLLEGYIQGIPDDEYNGMINGIPPTKNDRVYVGDKQEYNEDWLSNIFIDNSENTINHEININDIN